MIFFSNFFFEIYCSQLTGQRLLFTDYCSQFTVHRLLLLLLFIYCWSQYNNCIAIQFSIPSPFLATIHQVYCNTKRKKKKPFKPTILQYNSSIPLHTLAIQSVYCNTMAQQPTSLLQYNFSPLHHHIAIQFQYNFFSPAFSLAIQLQGCNTIFFFTRQLGSSPKTVFALFFFTSSYFQQLEKSPKK